MNSPIINGKHCDAEYVMYLKALTQMHNLCNAMLTTPAFVDYLGMVKELLIAYDPELSLNEQLLTVNHIIENWMGQPN